MNSILIVDSDGKALVSLQRRLRAHFENVHIAIGARLGLQRTREEGPFALIIAEFAMAEMDGIDFLAQVRELSPWTSRVLLSRTPMDVPDLLRVVNDAKAFHLLSATCTDAALHKVVTESLDRFKRIVVANQDRNDFLSVFANAAHDIVCSLRGYLRDMLAPVRPLLRGLCQAMGDSCPAITETAFLLSIIGLASLPPELMTRIAQGQPMKPEERALFATHPEYAVKMIRDLPQLIEASSILNGYAQLLRHEGAQDHAQVMSPSSVLLALAMDCRLKLYEGIEPAAIVEALKVNPLYTVPMLKALEKGLADLDQREIEVSLDQLMPGMVLAQPVLGTRDGREVVLAHQGYELSRTTIAVLLQSERQGQLRGPVMVRAGSIIPPADSGIS
jgi:CheY-like chemotaxis protein